MEKEIYQQLRNDNSIPWEDVPNSKFKKKEKEINGIYYQVFVRK